MPRFDWYVAFSGDVNWSGNRIDNTRQGWGFPFEVEANDTVDSCFMSDDMTLPVQFSNFNFSSATAMNTPQQLLSMRSFTLAIIGR